MAAHVTMLAVLEWSSALLTVIGAWLLANKGPRASWGFVFFLAANSLWICFAWISGLRGLLLQQIVLTAISLQGIWKGLLEPLCHTRINDVFKDPKP